MVMRLASSAGKTMHGAETCMRPNNAWKDGTNE